MRIRLGHVALPVVALVGGALVSTAWAEDGGGGGGSVNAAAENPEVSLMAGLSGSEEVPIPGAPDNPTPEDPEDGWGDLDGGGIAAFTLNRVTGQVCVVVDTEGIEPIAAAHIHMAPPGEPGPVVVNLSPTNGPTDYSMCANSTVEQVTAILANPGAFYFNVHTATYPDGAIRGQLHEAPGSVGGLTMLPEPVRAYDSRTGNDGPLAVDTTRTVDLTMGMGGNAGMVMGVAPGSRAAIVTVTVTQTGAAGYVRVYSNALIGQPATSTINWTAAGSDVATTTTVAVDATGKIKVAAGGTGTHFIVDVIGYYSFLNAAQSG